MKTRLLPVFLSLAVLGIALVGPLPAAPASASSPAKSHPVGAVARYGAIVVRPGDSAVQVAAFLGQPDQRLSADTWVYRHFQAGPGEATADGCSMLLIRFSLDRVTELQQVNEPAVWVLAAMLAAPVDRPRVAVAGK
jgi:hypothetical protein